MSTEKVRESHAGKATPGSTNAETRHSLQRRFQGTKLTPHTAPWITQCLHEEKTSTAVGILLAWAHPKRQVEADEITIEQLNQLTDDEVVNAIEELRRPSQYVQGTGGNKLTIPVTLATKANDAVIDTNGLVDSGSTGSCINRKFVEENHLRTKKLPRPIPVYNADGMLNKDGDIKETVTLRLIVQDHEEEITFAVSNLS